MKEHTIDVIIPLYKPDKKLEQLLEKLLMQSRIPDRIILLNTECFPDYSTCLIKKRVSTLFSRVKILGKKSVDVQILSIDPLDFDHGGTRAYGASLSDADYIIFLTQDAVPKDFHLIEELIRPMSDPQVAVTYGRQEASVNAGIIEQYTRIFNYPETDKKKTKEDVKNLGIKTYFCSDVCAAYRRETYEELGGFVKRTIFNEDMIFGIGAVEHGYAIYYAAKAKVIHSHQYTLMQQLRRNFDLGVSQTEYKDVFSGISSEKEGGKLVTQTLGFLKDQRMYIEMFEFFMECCSKYIGYFLGKRFHYLPLSWCIWLSMNKNYWRKDAKS